MNSNVRAGSSPAGGGNYRYGGNKNSFCFLPSKFFECTGVIKDVVVVSDFGQFPF